MADSAKMSLFKNSGQTHSAKLNAQALERSRRKRIFFITGTDTGVGKTIAVAVLKTLLEKQGLSVGVMKPVQCGGNDTRFLKNSLNLQDDISDINPFFAKAPLSPHLSFAREKRTISPDVILQTAKKLQAKYNVLLIEGAGGLMVPLKRGYFVADLIRDLDADVIVVSRLGLGTINHTLLTVTQARDFGLNVVGVLFNEAKQSRVGIPEKTNPKAVKEFGSVEVLGTIPYLKSLQSKDIIQACQKRVDVRKLLHIDDSSARTRELALKDKKYVWHPFTQMQDWLNSTPLVIDQAQGSYLIDVQGNRYIDGVSSLWVNVHGHRKREIDQAIKAQVNRLSHSTMLGLSNTPAIELAKELIDIVPRGLAKVFYSDNGSTAVEVAIKMAYQFWQNKGEKQKTQIAHLANSYHGDTLGSVSVGGIDLFHKAYRKIIFKTIKVDFPDCYRAPKGKTYPDYTFECFERFEKLIKREHKRIACFVVEPIVQGAAGMIMWPKGVLKRMHAVCKKYNVIFIADEVATGFGRTGKMFACEHEGVTPDILCLAKGITGGYLPLAATLTTKRIFDGFLFDYQAQKTFFHGHTYTGNPLACAAALANIHIFREESTLAKLQPKIKYLSERLQVFYNLPHVGQVRQRGFMVGIELVEDRATQKPFPWQEKIGIQVCAQARRYGIVIRPLGNVIVLMPPLSMSVRELDELLQGTYKAISEVTE